MRDANSRDFAAAGDHIIGECGREWLPHVRIWNFFEYRRSNALGDAALDLAVDNHWIDHRAAVFRDDVVDNFYQTDLRIDSHHNGMRSVGEDATGIGRLVGRDVFQEWFDAVRKKFLADVRRVSNLGEAD